MGLVDVLLDISLIEFWLIYKLANIDTSSHFVEYISRARLNVLFNLLRLLLYFCIELMRQNSLSALDSLLILIPRPYGRVFEQNVHLRRHFADGKLWQY